MAQILQMYHPELKANGECTEESYRTVYQFRGWELVTQAERFASDTLGYPVGSIDELKSEELYQVAVAAGFTGNKSSAKSKMAKAVRDNVGGDVAVLANIGETDVVDPVTGNVMTASEYEALQAERSGETPPSS